MNLLWLIPLALVTVVGGILYSVRLHNAAPVAVLMHGLNKKAYWQNENRWFKADLTSRGTVDLRSAEEIDIINASDDEINILLSTLE